MAAKLITEASRIRKSALWNWLKNATKKTNVISLGYSQQKRAKRALNGVFSGYTLLKIWPECSLIVKMNKFDVHFLMGNCQKKLKKRVFRKLCTYFCVFGKKHKKNKIPLLACIFSGSKEKIDGSKVTQTSIFGRFWHFLK